MKKLLMTLILSVMMIGCGSERGPELVTVKDVDLDQYAGKWYEIASYRNWFQTGCVYTTATYTVVNNTTFDVLNECRLGRWGAKNTAKAIGTLPDVNEPGKLKVKFFGLFDGDYYILELADDYSYAVVGSPSRQYLWILARKPKMNKKTYKMLLNKIEYTHSYDISKLRKTLQR